MIIQNTHKTPLVILDNESKLWKIEGRSIPENAPFFWVPIIEWMETNFPAQSEESLEISINMDYFNTSSSKMLLTFLKTVSNRSDVTIKWYYLEDDEDMHETGQDFAVYLNVNIELVIIP